MLLASAKRRHAHIDADAACLRQLGQEGDQYAAAAGAEIEQLERALAQALPIDDRERRFDQRLRIGPRVERARIDAERAPVELTDTDDARYRLAGKAPLDIAAEARRGLGARASSRPAT